MIRKVGSNAMVGMRDGIRSVRESGGRFFGEGLGRLGARAPLKRKSGMEGLGDRPGAAALAAVLLGLAVAAIVLYVRKRRQVAEHYNMGENEGAWEGGTLSGQAAFESARG